LSLAIADFQFCHLKRQKNNIWDFSAALSFGKFAIYDDFISKSYVGRLHKEFGYDPVATFDLRNSSGAVYIGSYSPSDETPFVGTGYVASGNQWSIWAYYYDGE
jgi:hypothetical protein